MCTVACNKQTHGSGCAQGKMGDRVQYSKPEGLEQRKAKGKKK